MSKSAHTASVGSTAKPTETLGQRNNRKRQRPGQTIIDPTRPLCSARHERFAQEIAASKTASEAYRLAGFKGKEPHKRVSEIRAIPGMEARIQAIRAEMAAKSMLTKERAMQLCAELAEGEHGAEPHHRISAMEKVGKWCGWEKGTEAEQAAAKALGGVSEMITRIRSSK